MIQKRKNIQNTIMPAQLSPTPASRSASDRSRILSEAVAECARRLEIGSTALKNVIGLSQPTASRLLNGKYAIPENSKEWELAAQFVRLYRALLSLVGSDEMARTWLNSPNQAFDGQKPAEVIKRIDGLLHTCDYLDAHRAVV